MSPENRFSHLDSEGRASMVDVSEKPITRRTAEASCRVILREETLERLSEMPKGDALAVARIAGVQAAKRTGELIPLAHPLKPEDVQIEFERIEGGMQLRSRVVVTARTGAEMEALTACAVAGLALYDMVKAVDRSATVTDLRLEAKSGGASGEFRRESDLPRDTPKPRDT
ncbi:MAG: cyclic pyranopterin monophosphate synthase MoaC [Thermoanaerobaculia bacterium]